NYRELKFNYRSTHRIVRFTNHVQAFRAALFLLRDLKPQLPWTTEPGSMPVTWYRATDAAFWKEYRDNSGFVVIVPCNEGEEYDFVVNDPILREHIRIDDGVPQNVLSAARAKGCEYSAVMVYGFGATADTDFVASLHGRAAPAGATPDQALPLQYFINRLYVAVSRAKRRLVIVDTDLGFAKLWACMQDEASESEMLSKIKNGREVWAQAIEGMTAGKPEDLSREAFADPLENARLFEDEGVARGDAFLLKQAAQAYRAAGDVPKSRECRARALMAEGSLLEAGDAFVEAGFTTEGVHCLWRGGSAGWKRVTEVALKDPRLLADIEVLWARALVEGATEIRAAEILTEYARRLRVDRAFAADALGDPIWIDALAALLNPLLDSKKGPLARDAATRLAHALDGIREAGVALPTSMYARVCFAAARFREAIVDWELAGDTKTSAYFQAKSATEKFPERLIWLAKIDATAEIVAQYREHSAVALSSEQSGIISNALRESGNFSEALSLAWNSVDANPMMALALRAFQVQGFELASVALLASVQLLVRQGRWDELLPFTSSGDFRPTRDWRDEAVRRWVRSENSSLQVALVRSLARSDELAKAAAHHQRGIADFLRGNLRAIDVGLRTPVTLAEAGAAYERTGRIIDALGFYEAVLRQAGN
ncbi:MAG: hypothetical protein IPP90_15080, partial [Gemmatimonadaceae bacterium]|nr:hypothetical protein [Gemmatimonadaceae bacterium]